MPNLFEMHIDGCTPLRPCTTCRAIDFLKSKLTVPDFAEFIAIASNSNPGYSQTNPAPADFPVDDLNLSVRASNALKNDNICSVGQLIKSKRHELLRMPNFGPRSLEEIEEALKKIGHSLPI